MRGRPADSWGTLGAVLARVVALDAPAWVSADTQHAAGVLLRRLRRDAVRVLTEHGPSATAGVLGVSRDTLHAARTEADGWLSGE